MAHSYIAHGLAGLSLNKRALKDEARTLHLKNDGVYEISLSRAKRERRGKRGTSVME